MCALTTPHSNSTGHPLSLYLVIPISVKNCKCIKFNALLPHNQDAQHLGTGKLLSEKYLVSEIYCTYRLFKICFKPLNFITMGSLLCLGECSKYQHTMEGNTISGAQRKLRRDLEGGRCCSVVPCRAGEVFDNG